MSFYGGRAGRSFSIEKVFTSLEEMQTEAKNTSSDWSTQSVPINGFVLLLLEDESSEIYIKQSTDSGYEYQKVGTLAALYPEIENGYWTLGGVQTDHLAVASQLQFRIKQKDEFAQYAFLTRIVEEEVQYGLCNLAERYIYNEELLSYDYDENGTLVRVIKANADGTPIYGDDGTEEYYEEYFDITDKENGWDFTVEVKPTFISTFVQQKYDTDPDEDQYWRDIFEVTDLLNISSYADEALRASSLAQNIYDKTASLLDEAQAIQEEVEETKETLMEYITETAGYAEEATAAAEDICLALSAFRKDIENNPDIDPLLSSLNAEIAQSRANFNFLHDRLDLMPYQYDTITEMQSAVNLSRGDKVFTFGRDNIGDGDSSKLFQIFDPVEDKDRLEELVEGSQTDQNPEGDKKISEQYPLANGLIAGLLTIFSGTGGGGGGGSAVPSITVTGSETGFSVKEGETITLEYYWTGPTAGTATLFIKDTKDSRVVDYYDSSKVYSSGVAITTGFGSGSVTLKLSKGEHNLTFYVIDRAQAFSNEVKVKVVVGGMSLTVDLPDGQTFTATSAITYNFTVNTIYSKHSVLAYTITQNGLLYDAGEIVSASSSMGVQSIRLAIKQASQNIGQGQFKITAYAYVQDDPDTTTNSITRNFVIMEDNVIYLTTSFDGDSTPGYRNEPLAIPLQLIYVGGSDFIIEGRYSEQEDFEWEDGTKTTPSSAEISRAGAFSFPLTFTDTGTYYVKFKASSNAVTATGYSEVIKVIIEESVSIYPLQREDALMVHYSARKGQTNATSKYTWSNISTQNAGDDATLVNFNYSSNGWETAEVSGVETPTGYLHCSGKAYVSIPYQFYQGITKTSGATCEIVFKSVDIGSDQTIFSMTYGEGAGFFVYKDKAVFNAPSWGVSNLTAYYNIKGVEEDDKPCHITLTIDPVEKYIKIYVNGVLTRADAEYEYMATSATNATRTYVNRGLLDSDPQYSITKVDCVRMYKTCLSGVEVLRNYIYNLRDDVEQATLWQKNYLDDDDDNRYPDTIPYMTFYLNKDDWTRMDKDNYKPKIRITYHDPNPPEGNETDYEWNGVKTSWQGTSSIAYPVKNFKLKLPSKYKLKGDNYSLGEKTFCLKADYMDSSHCHNTGTANFVHESGLLSNYTLTPAQSKELNISVAQGYKGLNNLPSTDLDGNELVKPKPVELKTRTCIDGHPIALYICLETDESAAIEDNPNREYENPLYWGIYNFNIDKGATDSFGLNRDTDDFQNVTSFEIAANSAYSGGGFRALRFVKKKDSEEYGWTRWNVSFTLDSAGNYAADTTNGIYLNITKAESSGTAIQGTEQVSFEATVDGTKKTYTGLYNQNLNKIKGVACLDDRYTESGTLDSGGNYIKLYQYDEVSKGMYIDPDTETYVVLGYYDYTATGWSFDVPFDSTVYGLKEEWELYGDYGEINDDMPNGAIPISDTEYILLKNPQDITAKYEYYERDFELRFPDEDVYLTWNDGKNGLYYKEYDKIVALVEWVDYVGTDIETHFTSEFKEHFDQDTMINYYLTVMTTGLIDNFGKNLMIDSWGYNKSGEIPYITDATGKHKVWKYLTEWDDDEEYWTGVDSFLYGYMDIDNPIETQIPILDEEGNETGEYDIEITYSVYDEDGELIETAEFGGIDGERPVGWQHEIDVSQIIWYPHFYDLDSSLGVNNSGILSFGPSIEMNDDFYIDIENNRVNNAPFNTSSSMLWQQLVSNFATAISSRFTELSSSILTLDTFKKYYFTNLIDVMGARMYNADAVPKYLSRDDIKIVTGGQVQYVKPYTYDYLALGTDWERTEKWLDRRISYLTYMFLKDSKEKSGTLELRTENPEKSYTLQVECYEPCYMRFLYANNVGEYVRVAGFNETITVTTPIAAGATDQEVYIDPPTNVKSFKEISNPQLGFSTVKIGNGEKLLEIDLSNSQGLSVLTMPSQKSLTKSINLSNCPNLSGALNGTNFPYLEYVNTMGTNMVFNFSPSGGAIETALIEATGTELNIVDHSDLKDLTIQLTYDEAPDEDKLNVGHNANYGSITLDNCSNSAFSVNVKGRYKDTKNSTSGKTVYAEVSQTAYNRFVKKYGIFSLFPSVRDLTIRNSLAAADSEQLQPNGETLWVKEFVLSLPRLRRLELVKTQFNKIAFVASSVLINGTTYTTGYPGWGGNPEVTVSNGIYTFTGDSNYISEKAEGIIGDDSIEELEFRGAYDTSKDPAETLPTSGKFEFPWRMYLGSMPNLKRLKFNTTDITPKSISYDATGTDGDQYYLTRPTTEYSSSWTPSRFELILPPPSGLEMIYFGPNVSKVSFTAIRQKDTNLGEYIVEDNSPTLKTVYNWPKEYFETIRTGSSDTGLGEVYFHPFRGVDLRGYSGLSMNFHGLEKIVGVAGMNALDVKATVEDYGENVFEGYFSGCKGLEIFHSATKDKDPVEGERPTTYTYSKWDFSTWFSPSYGSYFSNISKFMQNCTSFNDTSYLKGILNPSNSNGFKVENASYLFEGCSSLTNAEINWQNIYSTLNNIQGMFKNCSALEAATVMIKGLDPTKEEKVESLSEFFSGCTALTSPSIILLTDNSPSESAFGYIKNISQMFLNCESLASADFSLTFEDIDIDSDETYVYAFDRLTNASNWFKGCKLLETVKFPAQMNLAQLQSLDSGFSDCVSLTEVFVGSNISLYDEDNNDYNLSLSNLFSNCESLSDLGGFLTLDLRRCNSIDNVFSGCKSLTGELDLSGWTFNLDSSVSTRSAFNNCYNLTSIIIPLLVSSNVSSLFANCSQLTTLDVSPIEIAEGSTNFSNVFSNCARLTDDGFTGYQNWNVNKGYTFTGMFSGCSRIVSLDLTSWKVLGSESPVYVDQMFKGCSALQNINGLCDLFGTFEDVLARTKGAYNTQSFATGGVSDLFNGCSNLLLGQNDNNIAAWARMATKITTMSNMFQGCAKLTDLKLVFARGEEDTSTGDVSISANETLYWGSKRHSGTLLESNVNCKFDSLSVFSGMCSGCTSLRAFDYFDNTLVAYSDNSLYKYPTDISNIVAGCSSLKTFAFMIEGAGMHNLVSDLSMVFNGCSNLISITFPNISSSLVTGNQGIKKKMTLIAGLNEEVYWNSLATSLASTDSEGNITSFLYNFTKHGVAAKEENSEGILTVSSTTKDYAIMQPDSDFVSTLTNMGWSLVIPS